MKTYPLQHPLIICFLLLAVSAFGQVNTASLGGQVTDASQAVIQGVRVKARNLSTNLERNTDTDASGYYFFASLPVGPYEVSAEANGFQRTLKKVALETSQKAREDLQLGVGAVQTTVAVTGEAPQLSPNDATIGSVVDNTYVSQYPLLLRSWDDLLALVAGVQGNRYTEQSGATSAGRTGGFNVHGVRSLQNNFILDGVDNNSISENVQELTTQVVRPSVDTIQEFKVITNPYTAEFGRSPGAAINVTTKGGTNSYHGIAYEYLRNRVFDANDFFSNRNGLKKPQNVQNQFGGNLGGPIKRDKLFWFFDYEGTRIRRGVSRITTVPLPNERIGDLSAAAGAAAGVAYPVIFDPLSGQPFANNQIPAARIDPVASKLFALFPLPNLPGQLNNFTRNAGLSDDTDRYNGRVDWTPTDKDTVFGRYSFSDRARFIPGNFGGIADGTSTSAFGRQKLLAHGATIGWSRVLSPRIVNEAHVAYSRDNSFAAQDPFGKNHTADYVPGVPVNPTIDGGVSRTTFSGFPSFIGSPDFLPKFQVTSQWQFNDSLSVAMGRHALKFGADLHAPLRNNFMDVPGTRGSLNFDRIFSCQRNAAGQCVSGTGLSYADGLLGYVQSAQLTNVYLIDQRLHMYSFFAQDDFKASSKLTLNLGLRYDFASPPLEAKNRTANFNPADGGSLIFGKSGSLRDRATVKANRLNFAPRAGFAYSLNNKTVVRGGYGIFYQAFERYGSEDQLALNPPYLINNTPSVASNATAPVFLLRNGYPADFLDPAKLDLRRVRVRAVDPNSSTPYTQQWSFGFQRTLPLNLFVEADYVGTSSTHLTALLDYNQPINGKLPYPKFGYIEYRSPVGSSNYHGLDLTVERRLLNGLAFRVAYTYSHSIDNVGEPLNSNSGNAQDGRNYRAWRASSDFDIRQRTVVSYVYELPFGKGKALASSGPLAWILGGFRTSGGLTFATGRPYTITSGGSLSNALDPFGAATAVPNVIGTPRSPQNVNCWYYASKNPFCQGLQPNATDAFALQSPGQFGNAGRNILRAPGTRVIDFSVERDFAIREAMRLELRWEVFNLTNTVQFGAPNRDFSSKAAGTITSLAGDPRLMQFALRLRF